MNNRGWFRKNDPRLHKGRRRGSRNRVKTEPPYRCFRCRAPMGKAWERRPLTKAQIPARLRQIERMKQVIGQPRRGRYGFERGMKDTARNRFGRPIGSRDKAPRVPLQCPQCKARVTREERRVLKKRWSFDRQRWA
jgi:hypothetical protein